MACFYSKAGSQVNKLRDNFWEEYSLGELNRKEWEALCDGCGQCCLIRHEEKNQVRVYNIGCNLLNPKTARCVDYPNRKRKVTSCHQLTAQNIGSYNWLPESCTYRRLHRGENLPAWHPLLAGDRNRMRKKQIVIPPYIPLAREIPKRKLEQHLLKVKPI